MNTPKSSSIVDPLGNRKMPSCPICSKQSHEVDLQVCGGCHNTYYCGKECQKKDWKDHKLTCQKTLIPAGHSNPNSQDIFKRDTIAWLSIHKELLHTVMHDVCSDNRLRKFMILVTEYIPNITNKVFCMQVRGGHFADRDVVKRNFGKSRVWESIEAEDKVMKCEKQGYLMMIIIAMPPEGYDALLEIHSEVLRVPADHIGTGVASPGQEWFRRIKEIAEFEVVFTKFGEEFDKRFEEMWKGTGMYARK